MLSLLNKWENEFGLLSCCLPLSHHSSCLFPFVGILNSGDASTSSPWLFPVYRGFFFVSFYFAFGCPWGSSAARPLSYPPSSLDVFVCLCTCHGARSSRALSHQFGASSMEFCCCCLLDFHIFATKLHLPFLSTAAFLHNGFGFFPIFSVQRGSSAIAATIIKAIPTKRECMCVSIQM